MIYMSRFIRALHLHLPPFYMYMRMAAGIYIHLYLHNTGKQPQLLTPLQELQVNDLRNELRARGHYELDQHKPELQKDLKHLLKGVNRVPSMLLLNPQQSLQNLHLTNYTVLNCEQGHLANLLEELPSLLPSEKREKCNDLMKAKLDQRGRYALYSYPLQPANEGKCQSMGASTSPFHHQGTTDSILR